MTYAQKPSARVDFVTGYHATWRGEFIRPMADNTTPDDKHIINGAFFSSGRFNPTDLPVCGMWYHAIVHAARKEGNFPKGKKVIDLTEDCLINRRLVHHHYCAEKYVLGYQVRQLKNILHENEKNASETWLDYQQAGEFLRPDDKVTDKALFALTSLGSLVEIPNRGRLWQFKDGKPVAVTRKNAKKEAAKQNPAQIDQWLENSFPSMQKQIFMHHKNKDFLANQK
jgi:hypothetical protein